MMSELTPSQLYLYISHQQNDGINDTHFSMKQHSRAGEGMK